MKSRFRVFTITTLLILSFVMIACDIENDIIDNRNYKQDNNSLQSTNALQTTNNTKKSGLDSILIEYEPEEYIFNEDINSTDGEYLYSLSITKELLDEIYNSKHNDYEIPLNFNGYTTNELSSLVLSTSTTIWYANDENNFNFLNGNIYDIDDNYIYIISCSHGIGKENDFSLDNLRVRFISEEVIKPIYVKKPRGDFSLIVVDKKSLSNETLNVIKSINTKYLYQTLVEELKVYGFMYNAHTYSEYNATIENRLAFSLRLYNSNLKNGASGGGMFDIYGNYYGCVKSLNCLTYSNIFPDFYNAILEFNPYYGN